MSIIPFYDSAAVYAQLDYPGCIEIVRAAMSGLTERGVAQPLRNIVELSPGRLFAQMPGLISAHGAFGAKLLSVFSDTEQPGRAEHRGAIVLFDPSSGEVACVADAGAVTHIRTAAASAVATDVLARPDARRLAIFGCGAQAESHIRALALVRNLEEVIVWGRDLQRATFFAAGMAKKTGLCVYATADGRTAAQKADIICTVTAAPSPILLGDWIKPGTHINAVGSSFPGPVEVDDALLLASRYIVDSRRSALQAAAEFLNAKAAGLVDDDHISAEIGEVLLQRVPGRTSNEEVTLYKSLGHIVQDLAATAYLSERASAVGR